MSDTTQATVPAGWYADTTPGQERYWNGTTWEDAVRPTPGTEAPKPKSKRTGWIIAGGIVALAIVIGIIGAAAGAGSDDDAQAPATSSQEDVAEAPAEPEEPVEEEPATSEAGTLDNPHPKGYVASIFQGSEDNTLADVTVAIKSADADKVIAQANQFNDAAQKGYHYVAVEYTLTGASKTEPANVSLLLYDWTLSQEDGTMIAESNSTVVLPDGWNQTYDVNDLYDGQTGSAVVIYQVPDSYKGALFATAYGQYITL